MRKNAVKDIHMSNIYIKFQFVSATDGQIDGF